MFFFFSNGSNSFSRFKKTFMEKKCIHWQKVLNLFIINFFFRLSKAIMEKSSIEYFWVLIKHLSNKKLFCFNLFQTPLIQLIQNIQVIFYSIIFCVVDCFLIVDDIDDTNQSFDQTF